MNSLLTEMTLERHGSGVHEPRIADVLGTSISREMPLSRWLYAGGTQCERCVMAWVLAVGLVGFVVFLVFGSITGHVKVTSCCGVPDPRCDARMRDAFLDAPNHPTVACHPTVDEPG